VYFTLLSHLAALAAGGVLVRDASQLNRLRRLGFRRLELSKPIICAGHETAATRTPPGRPLRLLFVGIFAPRKGLNVLFEALALARKRCENPQDIQLTLIGGGRTGGVEQWSTDEVAAMATAAGLDPGSVEFTGYLSDPEELQRRYRAAGALVHPSFQEGFPRVIDEAMLNGLPVIAAAIPQISQVLRTGEDALLATPRSAESLADCIFRLLDDSTLYDRLARGAAARQRVLRGESAAQQHLRLLLGSATD
jgi:glycosyltransferase involved in cell wall biosynthesis